MWYHAVQTIDIYGVHIQVWGLMLAIGVILAWFLFDYNLLWRHIKHDSSWVMSGGIIAGLLGSRVLQIILDWNYYFRNPVKMLAIWEGGMASYGAYIFVFIFLFWYIKKYVKEKTDFLEAAVGPMFLALSIARMGCLMINDHFGKLSSVPWAILSLGELRHPISLYYVIFDLGLFLFASWAFYKGSMKGYLFWLSIGLYGFLRLAIDLFWKDWQGNYPSFYGTILASVLFGVLGTFMVWRILSKKQKF
jgi:phosphatidylglycerol:prolipoprotein diacylglycerol transferase